MTPVSDSCTDWWCAMDRANHYARTYQVRYVVFWVICPGYCSGGWWMIAPH